MQWLEIAVAVCLTTAACSGNVSPGQPSGASNPPARATATTSGDGGDGDAGGGDSATGHAVGDDSGVEATTGAATCAVVVASSYDQRCVEDTDCVLVGEVPNCPAEPQDNCRYATVNSSAEPQYMADLYQSLASIPPGSLVGVLGSYSCPATGIAVCRNGTCQPGNPVPPNADTLPACTNAGGVCAYTANTTSNCANQGPSGSCAYADETCCL